jgi:hypothetical protein
VGLWPCGMVQMSDLKFFPLKLNVFCCGLVDVWDGPKKIQLFCFFKLVDNVVGLWPCGMVQI